MARLLRGDIVWADLDLTQGHEQSGKRPVLIISHEVFNQKSDTVIALALTSQPQRAEFPLTYKLAAGVLPKPSWVKIGQIRTLPVLRLSTAISRLSESEVNEIISGLNEIVN